MKAVLSTAVSMMILTLAVLRSYAQGTVNWGNSPTTLISLNGAALATNNSVYNQFIFAVFLAPSTAVSAPGQTVSWTDPQFQTPAAYNTNSALALGRINTRSGLDVGSPSFFPPGSTVDFVIRAWHVSMGRNWNEALNTYLFLFQGGPYAYPPRWALGHSKVGNNILLGGGAIPTSSLMGFNDYQVSGFNLFEMPEPTTSSLLLLSSLLFLRRRRD